MHVYARMNVRGEFLEVKLPSYDVACVDVYLKVPEEENSSGWRSFAKFLSDFAGGVRTGGMEMMDTHEVGGSSNKNSGSVVSSMHAKNEEVSKKQRKNVVSGE